jgi:spore maturation protein CgeB
MISLRKPTADSATPKLKVIVPTPLYGGSLPLAYHAASAFSELGHECEVVKFDDFYASYQTIGATGAQSYKKLQGRFAEILGEYVVEKAVDEHADVVWFTAQSPVTIAGLQRLREAGIRTALWFVEDVRRFDYWKYIAREFDVVFTIQQGAAANALHDAGAKRVVYLPVAANPKLHKPLATTEAERARFGSPVSFVGAGYSNRVELFSRLNLSGLKLWGNDWPESWNARLEENGRRVTPEETALIYNCTDINLNIHSAVGAEVLHCGDFVNPRTFEIAACGGFQIVNRQNPLAELFSSNELCIVDHEHELASAIQHFAAEPEKRYMMAERSRQRVLREHTYTHRIAEALKHIFATPVQARLVTTLPTIADLKTAAWGNVELTEFLSQFDDDKPARLADLVANVGTSGRELSKAELTILMMHEFRNWGLEKGVIQ